MDLLLALSHVLAFLMLALALAVPAFRRLAMVVLAVVAVLGLAMGFGILGDGPEDGQRTLTTVHTYAGFDGSAMEVSMVSFPTNTEQPFTAEAYLWPLPFAGFAGLWILLLRVLGRGQVRNPWLLPLGFAWTAMASWLGMQFLAAPAALVQPIGLDRFLWPAGLALALVAAQRARSQVALFLMVGSGTMLGRLPAALFSKYASDHHLGSCLDISVIRDIVNPMTQLQFDPRIVCGSGEQQFWLIWLEHIIFFPAVYLMSLFGIAMGAYMFHRHGPETEAPTSLAPSPQA